MIFFCWKMSTVTLKYFFFNYVDLLWGKIEHVCFNKLLHVLNFSRVCRNYILFENKVKTSWKLISYPKNWLEAGLFILFLAACLICKKKIHICLIWFADDSPRWITPRRIPPWRITPRRVSPLWLQLLVELVSVVELGSVDIVSVEDAPPLATLLVGENKNPRNLRVLGFWNLA